MNKMIDKNGIKLIMFDKLVICWLLFIILTNPQIIEVNMKGKKKYQLK